MKKLLLTAALLVSTTLLFSQTKFGVKAGVNFASVNVKEEGSSSTYSPSSRLSFHLTGFADIALTPLISFQPGIGVSGKGFKIDESFDMFGTNVEVENTTSLFYLEVPLNAVAKFNAGAGKFFIGAGPYIGYGISGKTKSVASGTDEDGQKVSDSEEADIEFGNGEDEVKALDFGLNVLSGYQLSNGLSLNLGYGLGLSNLAQEGSGGSLKNKVFSVSLGFLF